MFCACTVRGEEKDPQVAPVVFFNLQSPTLDIPMRVEVPLRALLKGGRKLQGTYSVYLHALLTDVGEEFVYYGITKSGWNTRFSEHVNSSIRKGSQRPFPRKLEELNDARAAEVSGVPDGRPKLAGTTHTISAAGLTEAPAMTLAE